MFNWPVIQGQAAKLKIRVSACPLTGTEILAATVSTGLTDAALISFSPKFDAAGPPDIWLSVTPSQTASLAPGPYVVNVKLASNSGEIAYGLLEVVAAPGNQPAYDVLATPAMVLMLK